MTTHRTYIPLHIDFTPFVDLAFLLLTFFVLLKVVETPNRMQVNILGGSSCFIEEKPSADAHLFLLANNRIGFFTYRPDGSKAEFVETDYSVRGLRKQLRSIKRNHRTIVIISPTDLSTYKNIVDVLDELQILGSIQFKLGYSLTHEEKTLLAKYETYKASEPKEPVVMPVDLYDNRIPLEILRPVNNSL